MSSCFLNCVKKSTYPFHEEMQEVIPSRWNTFSYFARHIILSGTGTALCCYSCFFWQPGEDEVAMVAVKVTGVVAGLSIVGYSIVKMAAACSYMVCTRIHS